MFYSNLEAAPISHSIFHRVSCDHVNKHLLRHQLLLRAVKASTHIVFSTSIRQPFVYSDNLKIARISRSVASYSPQELLPEQKMVSPNTC